LRYEVITSPNNPRLKRAMSLREAKHRKREGLILIDGPGLIDRALTAGVDCRELYVNQNWVEGLDPHGLERIQTWLDACSDMHIVALGPAAMAKLRYGDREDDAIAVAVPPDTSLSAASQRMDSERPQLFLVLDRMEKPGNLGAMVRSADASGATAVFISDPICELWNPNAIRSSLGTLFTVPIAVSSESELLGWLKEREATIYAARVDQGTPYTAVTYPASVAIVIGNEAAGLQGRWHGPEVQNIFIPMHGQIDSLNASVCSAVMMFEVVRQNGSP
jgi:TrmH family RNA methyltransferase